MTKNFKYYLILWILLVALFNVVCFVTPASIWGYDKYAGGFWSGYIWIMIAFILHLAYAYYALCVKNEDKRILNQSVFVISIFELILMVLIASVCMLIPNFPNWLGTILCFAVLVFSIGMLVSASAVEENKFAANDALNAKTNNFRELTDLSAQLVSKTKDPECVSKARAVAEAIRYSDPVSSPSLKAEEEEIRKQLNELTGLSAKTEKKQEYLSKTEELLLLIEQRNNHCKSLKRSIG